MATPFQKVRVLHAVEAAAANPAASTLVGSTMADVVFSGLREVAGTFHAGHPWVHSGDWDYAFKAHFDFVVHERLDAAFPTRPLFAVEFDGSSHNDPSAQVRDRRKNRLCAASGLPLVRIDETFLFARERLTLVDTIRTPRVARSVPAVGSVA